MLLLKSGWKSCPYGDDEVYRSCTEPMTWLNRMCGIFLLQLVRCRRCQLRHYRPLFFPAPEYPLPIRAGVQKAPSHANEENRKRSV